MVQTRGSSFKVPVHLGSRETGKVLHDYVTARAQYLNMMNVFGKPNLSGYIVLLIKKDMEKHRK